MNLWFNAVSFLYLEREKGRFLGLLSCIQCFYLVMRVWKKNSGGTVDRQEADRSRICTIAREVTYDRFCSVPGIARVVSRLAIISLPDILDIDRFGLGVVSLRSLRGKWVLEMKVAHRPRVVDSLLFPFFLRIIEDRVKREIIICREKLR